MSECIDIYIDTTTKVPEDATEFDYEMFEHFMSGGPWVAHSEYMKLKDENDKLREQSERLFDKTLELATENSKLREELESVGTAAYLYGRSDIKAENDKLRELVKEMRVCLEDECKRCHEWGDACDLEHQLRELGVEVDG